MPQTAYGLIVILLVAASRAPGLQIVGNVVTMNPISITNFPSLKY